MVTTLKDWRTSFEEIWKKINVHDEKIDKLLQENQMLKERVEQLETFNKIMR